MDIANIKEIAVLKNTITFLRICFIFPNKEEINQPEKNVFIKYTLMNVIGIYFPIGIAMHLIVNIASKFVLFYPKAYSPI